MEGMREQQMTMTKELVRQVKVSMLNYKIKDCSINDKITYLPLM